MGHYATSGAGQVVTEAFDETFARTPIDIAFGRRMQLLRREHMLTLKQVASDVGESLDTMESIERGTVSADLEFLDRLAIAWGLTISELLTGL